MSLSKLKTFWWYRLVNLGRFSALLSSLCMSSEEDDEIHRIFSWRQEGRSFTRKEREVKWQFEWTGREESWRLRRWKMQWKGYPKTECQSRFLARLLFKRGIMRVRLSIVCLFSHSYPVGLGICLPVFVSSSCCEWHPPFRLINEEKRKLKKPFFPSSKGTCDISKERGD